MLLAQKVLCTLPKSENVLQLVVEMVIISTSSRKNVSALFPNPMKMLKVSAFLAICPATGIPKRKSVKLALNPKFIMLMKRNVLPAHLINQLQLDYNVSHAKMG